MNRLVKKLIGWILCAVMVVGMLPVAAREAKAADTDAGAPEGIVLKEGCYEISSYEGLLEFSRIVNGTSAQFEPNSAANAKIVVEEIDASASNPSSSGYNTQTTAWTPIGNYDNPYTGTFDGNGFTITGLTIESTNDYIGLFGYVGSDGIVQNVYLEGGSIKGGFYVGSMVGGNYGTVTNCYNTGDVEGSYNSVGGVVGGNYGIVTNCYNTGDVEGSCNSVGGVVGDNYGKVSGCHNTGKVTGSGYIGGVVGYNHGGVVSNCYNAGVVIGSGYVGGVAGWNERIVSNCYNTGDVEGNIDVGGVVGDNYDSGEVSNCYNASDVIRHSWDAVGGVAGDNDGTVSNCYYNKSICQTGAINGSDDGENNVRGLTTAEMTGINAMDALTGFKDENGKSEWIVRENSLDTYYYPHLKGFAYDTTEDVKDWTATISSGYTYELDSDAFVYDGKDHKPVVTVKKNGDEVEGKPYSFTFVESVNAGEYTIKFENTETGVKGVIPYSIKKRELKITARNQTFTYNGQIQGPGDMVYEEKKEIEELFDIGGDGLADTHSISSITLDGQGNEAETHEKVLIPSNAVIVNIDGDVVTTNYEIEYIPGDLIISPIPVTLTANSGTTVTYDGTEKTVSGYTCSVEGLTFDGVTAGVSATKAGTYEVTFSGVKVNETKDSTGHYMVSKTENGTLTINRKPLTITADSASAECDGTILIKNSYKCSELAAGDTIKSITITGKQDGPGSSDNVPSAAKIVNVDGEDVTDCYDITYVNGKLIVSEHSFDQEVADTKYLKSEAGCIHAAVYYESCKCGEKGTETFESGEPLGHDYKAVEGTAVAPTCEKPGKEADQKCERCGDVITGKEIPATGHTWKAATGYAPKTCEICGATEGDVIKYTVEGGNTIEFTQGDQKNIIKTYHRSEDDKHAIDHHKGVQIDGKDVQVDAKSGSVILTFDAATLNALGVGDHVIKVIFDDWVDELKLVIKAPVAPIADATPTTGDSSLPVLWVTLLLLSMAGASAVVMRRRKRA
jgi:The GLUG motif.